MLNYQLQDTSKAILLGLVLTSVKLIDDLKTRIQIWREKQTMAKKTDKKTDKKDKSEKKEVVKTFGQAIGQYLDGLEKSIKDMNEKLDVIVLAISEEEDEDEDEDEEDED